MASKLCMHYARAYIRNPPTKCLPTPLLQELDNAYPLTIHYQSVQSAAITLAITLCKEILLGIKLGRFIYNYYYVIARI